MQNTHFLRCLKPNKQKLPAAFDEDFISQQLKSFSIAAYVDFMQTGYPVRIIFEPLTDAYEMYIKEFQGTFKDKKQFFAKLLLSIGFKSADFKLGETIIFVRKRASSIVNEKLNVDSESIVKNIA